MLRIKIFCNFERYIVMADFEIIKCHGSGNDFVMVDTTREKSFAGVDRSAFARAVSDRVSGIGSDGVLYVVRHDDGHYAMDMYNPDGTQAEMCGNGMRCVARLADERGYIVDGILPEYLQPRNTNAWFCVGTAPFQEAHRLLRQKSRIPKVPSQVYAISLF